uniref:Molybdopterin synthase sulfur carrier subunit n=1 Tax=Schizophyllum commune (strain H4-8 / FGSC 9210) TaxID=578458 RepID=D8QJA2_SCHCM
MPPPQITVLYFAAASTATGLTSETIVLPSPSPSAELASGAPSKEQHPGTNLAGILRDSQWSVDAEMVDDPERVVLTGGEEVAVICPVSGG